ncbi:hypothetical protein VNI00_013345 [Paramarasmius palmivorus]|uniref:alpha-L-fucosidase n=1 Tax=Paramarasmius palmivorus TaxID=297713 RepID=A0AAW0C0X2_9AGAR
MRDYYPRVRPLVALFIGVVAARIQDFPIVQLPLDFDNIAASTDGSASFDTQGGSFDSQFLPTGTWVHDAISYNLPAVWGSENDNLISNSQLLTLDEPAFVHELHLLFAGDAGNGDFTAQVSLNLEDETSQVIDLLARDWWSFPLLNTGAIRTPYHFIDNGSGKNFNLSQIFQWSTSVLSEQKVTGITLPAASSDRRLHFWAVAISPSTSPDSSGPPLAIRRARFTNRWETVGDTRAQVVEVTVANLLPSNAISANNSLNAKHTVEISGFGIQTLTPGVINRLVPGDQVRVDVLVSGAQSDTNATVELKDASGQSLGTSDGWPATALIEQWTSDTDVLSEHETPTWWNNAKYGIFIHWGVYSAPAWGPPNAYAEWYDYDYHNRGSASWQHHLDTYGPNVIYDDFIANFTASKFNASEWVNLFDDAGARYFVFVTKHHDGYALFDTGDSTHRSSVHLNPQRDFLSELFETSAREKPNLHRGTYYSLPEWFNPDFGPYGFGAWPGHLAVNPYNDTSRPGPEPYTGKLNISDYLDDIQLAHMLDLAKKYNTEIMWCDIGGPNRTPEFAAQYYNDAFEKGNQVTINNRCGAVPDFDTPEYSSFSTIQTRSWESNAGMDPFSYGFNSATDASQYKNGTTIIRTLVDIVSKNGNFLLDVGPTAEGEIIAAMADNLRDAGSWLRYSGECVYDTSFWFEGSQDIGVADGFEPARFTTTPDTFCIVAFDQPSSNRLVVNKRLPVLEGDEIVLLTPNGASESLLWSVDANSGALTIDLSSVNVGDVRFAWAFQVRYKLDG